MSIESRGVRIQLTSRLLEDCVVQHKVIFQGARYGVTMECIFGYVEEGIFDESPKINRE